MNKRVASFLSLSQRAGYVLSGSFICEKALVSGKARFMIIACDASPKTAKRFSDKARYYGILCMQYGLKDELGAAIGKDERAIIVITDERMALNIAQAIKDAEDL